MREIENQKTDASSKPYAEVRILSCGELIPKSKGKVYLSIYIYVNRGHFANLLKLASTSSKEGAVLSALMALMTLMT